MSQPPPGDHVAGCRPRGAPPWPKPRYDNAAWRRAAACRREDPEAFFPVGSTGVAAEQIERAKAVCAACPVQSPCLTFALTSNQEFGVWGGCDEDERRLLRRQRRAEATSEPA